MNKCFNCQKEYKSERGTSKFCSVNCRVQYHRKIGGKKKEVTPIQVQVLYNTMMEALGRINAPVIPNHYDAPRTNFTFEAETPSTVQPKAFLSMQPYKWTERRRKCATPEDFEQWKGDVNADPNLSIRDRNLVLQTI